MACKVEQCIFPVGASKSLEGAWSFFTHIDWSSITILSAPGHDDELELVYDGGLQKT